MSRSSIRRATVSAALTLGFLGGAAVANADTPATASPFGTLVKQSAGDSAATDAVSQLFGAALKPAIAVDTPQSATTPARKYIYPAPTSTCTVGGDHAGVTLGVARKDGVVTFKAVPGFAANSKTSQLKVAWINLSNGKSAITPLNGAPASTKTVNTGSGHVLVTMFGSIKNSDGKTCDITTPTVGQFTA